MTLAVRRSEHELQQRPSRQCGSSDKMHAILDHYGVPLVKCDSCLISGDLPRTDRTSSQRPRRRRRRAPRPVSIAQLQGWLKHGADPKVELNNAVVATTRCASRTCSTRCTCPVTARHLQGETPLHYALIQRSPRWSRSCLAHGADVNQRDRDGWTPLMTAAYCNDAATQALAVKGTECRAGRFHAPRHRHAIRQGRGSAGAGRGRALIPTMRSAKRATPR